jgi:hypothetical protein
VGGWGEAERAEEAAEAERAHAHAAAAEKFSPCQGEVLRIIRVMRHVIASVTEIV